MDTQIPQDSASQEISGFVLAGGRSSRLGQDKVLLPWDGQTLLSHAVQLLQQICGTVRVCTDRTDLQQYIPAANPPIPDSLIRDALPDAGPLSGIVAALEKSQTEWNLFLAVDLPLVPVGLLEALAARAGTDRLSSIGLLCVIPQVVGMPQPLCGLYHRALAPGLRAALQEGKYKIMLALQEAVLEMEGRQIPLLEPVLGLREGLVLGTPASRLELFDVQNFAAAAALPASHASEWFLNINTTVDLQRARELSSTKNDG